MQWHGGGVMGLCVQWQGGGVMCGGVMCAVTGWRCNVWGGISGR